MMCVPDLASTCTPMEMAMAMASHDLELLLFSWAHLRTRTDLDGRSQVVSCELLTLYSVSEGRG